jgi:hypothetical protein
MVAQCGLKNNDTNQENGRGALFTFNLPLSIQ